MAQRRYRIDIEPRGKRFFWTVWAWGSYFDDPNSEAWRPPWVAIKEVKIDCGQDEGKAKTMFEAEYAARNYIAKCEATISETWRRIENTVKIEIEV